MINKVMIEGNLTRDCEVRDTKVGELATFTVAVNNRRKVDGEWTDNPAFVKVTKFKAEKVIPSLRKGQRVAVMGRIEDDSYEVDGRKRSGLQVIADDVLIVGKPSPAETQMADDDIPF